jgi:pimeloyl-ACP methyl ester carboxylesterase
MPAMPEVAGVEHSEHDLTTGVRVHVAAAGPPVAPPVLCLHGWPQHWWSWRDVIAQLRGEYRLLCPDLRGLGWSGRPADDDFRKDRLADDAIALLDALGIEQARLVGHDWGAWAAILAAQRAPDRVSSLLAVSIASPWVPRRVAVRNAHRLAYQLPIAAPVLGSILMRDGTFARRVLEVGRRDGRGWTAEELETYVAVIREPEGAHASIRLYRQFLTRELPAAAAGSFAKRGFAIPARLLFGRRDPLGRALTEGFRGEVEIVDGAGHFLLEELPAVVAERIRAM